MTFVTLAEAKLHLRVDDSTEDTLIAACIGAAEQTAASIIDRDLFADSTAWAAAAAAAPAALAAATLAYADAIAAADLITDDAERAETINTADNAMLRARAAYRCTQDGMVVNDTIKAAVLLLVGHLFANREDVATGVSIAKLPQGAEWLLQPFKAYR